MSGHPARCVHGAHRAVSKGRRSRHPAGAGDATGTARSASTRGAALSRALRCCVAGAALAWVWTWAWAWAGAESGPGWSPAERDGRPERTWWPRPVRTQATVTWRAASPAQGTSPLVWDAAPLAWAASPRAWSPSAVAASAPAAVAAGAPSAYLPVLAKGHEWPRRAVFGMQISEDRFRDPEMIRSVRAAGATWLRTFLFWDEVEPVRTRPPTYDWRLYDPLFRAASEQGLNVIAEIQGNPRWVADFPGGPPRDLDALAQFVAAAVERYDGDGHLDGPGQPVVRYWELYNEPDNTDAQLAMEGRGWGFWGFHGAEYARMLKRVYPAVKIASPAAQVVFGGVAYDGFIPHDGPFNPRFTDDVLAAGGGPFFDVMNFHYYPLFAGNWREFGIGIVGKAAAVRAVLAQHGLEKPLMLTEAGSWSAASPPYPSTTPQEQANYVVQLHARALVADMRAVCWFTYDDVAGVDDPARGLVDRDLRAKPALAAYRVASEALGGARYHATAAADPAGAEVYWFRRGAQPLAAAWSNDGVVRHLALRAPGAWRTRAMGGRLLVTDEADGALDGVTHVPFGREPVFVAPLAASR